MSTYTSDRWSATHLFQIIETGEIVAYNNRVNDQYLEYKHRMWTQTNDTYVSYVKVMKSPCIIVGDQKLCLVSIYSLKIAI